MNICLIAPVLNIKNAFEPSCHLGLAYIKAVLIKNGYNVDVIDAPVSRLSNQDIFDRLKQKEYHAVGISCYYYNYDSAYRIMRHLHSRYPDIFVFLGGYLPTLAYDKMQHDFSLVQCMVIGEGELTTLRLVESIEKGQDFKKIPGLAYMEQGEIQFSGQSQLIEDLDTLPFPEYIFNGRTKTINLSTSRGCYGSCNFCGIRNFYSTCKGKYIRRRSPENLVKEIESVIDLYHPKSIIFADDNFYIGSRQAEEWFYQFYALIKQKNIHVNFDCNMRANEVISKQHIIKDFIEIGLKGIFIGVESFLDKHLLFYNKKVTAEQNKEAVRILDGLDVCYDIGYLLYNPITTLEDIEETIQIIRQMKFNQTNKHIIRGFSAANVSAMYGTPLSEYVFEHQLENSSKKGYRIMDERAELCYEAANLWQTQSYYIYEKTSLYYEAVERQDKVLEKELTELFYALFLYDLDVLERIVQGIRSGKQTVEEFEGLLRDRHDNLSGYEKRLAEVERLLAV